LLHYAEGGDFPAILLKMKILTKKSYTFSSYFKLPNTPTEILAELGYTFCQNELDLIRFNEDLPFLADLEKSLAINRRVVFFNSESTRREAIIFPILVLICDCFKFKLNPETSIKFNEKLQGTLDYLAKNESLFLVVEAKNADLDRGFTQLAAEMIAIAGIEECDRVYGAVTNGVNWKFGILDRQKAAITEDLNIFSVPQDLEDLCRVLIGILKN
jgi:hypothetical protein